MEAIFVSLMHCGVIMGIPRVSSSPEMALIAS